MLTKQVCRAFIFLSKRIPRGPSIKCIKCFGSGHKKATHKHSKTWNCWTENYKGSMNTRTQYKRTLKLIQKLLLENVSVRIRISIIKILAKMMRLRELASQMNCLSSEKMWRVLRSRFGYFHNKVIIVLL